MGTVHAVGGDTGRRSDNDRTDNFGLVAGGSWWCGEEGMGNSHLVAAKKVLISEPEGVNWPERLLRTM